MSEKQYLILSPDGSRAVMSLVSRAGLEAHLEQAAKFAEEGGYDVDFLASIPTQPGTTGVHPGAWEETQELILEVRVVVPQPVTVKWQIP